MPRYFINGKTYNIPDDRVQDFLSKNLGATKIEDSSVFGKVSLINPNQGAFGFEANYFEPVKTKSIVQQQEQPEIEQFEKYEKEDYKVDRKALYGDSYDEFDEIMNVITNNNLGYNEEEQIKLNQEAGLMFGQEVDGEIIQPNLNPDNLITQEQFDLIGKKGANIGFDIGGLKEFLFSFGAEAYGRNKKDLKDKILDEPTQQKITTVLDYKKRAKNELINRGIKEPTQTEILKAAKQLYIDDKKSDEFNRELEEYIEDLDGKRNIFKFAKGDEQNKLAEISKIAKSTLDTQSKVLLARSADLESTITDINNKLKNLLDKEYTDPNKRLQAYNKALALNKELNNNLRQYDRVNEQYKVLIEDDEQLSKFADQIGRNFNWMPNLGGKTLVGLTDLGVNLEELVNRFNPKTLLQNQILSNKENMPDWAVGLAQLNKNKRDLALKDYDAWKNNITGSLAAPQNFADNKTLEDWMEWGVDTIATQGAQTALMIVAPAASLYVISASSAGSKFKEMQKEIDLGMENYSPFQIYTTSILTGAAEGLSEKVTLGQLKRVKLGIQATKRAKSGVIRQLKDNFFNIRSLKAGIYDPIEEGATEVISQVVGNLADKFIAGKEDVDIYDGVKESFASGVFMSGLVYKSPYVANLVSAPFRTQDLNSKFNDNAKQIIQLSQQLQNNLDSKSKNIIESKITDLVKSNAEIRVNQSLAIDYLTKPQQDNLVSLYQQEVQNTRLINQFKSDPSLKNTKAAKDQIIELETENGIIQKQRNEIMAPAIQQRLDSDLTFAEATAQKLNLPEIQSLSTAQITKQFGPELANKDGFFNKSTGEIVINPEVAAKTEAVTVGSHEVLHGILNQTLNTTTPEGLQQAQTVVQDFRKQLSPEQNAILDQKLENYSPEYLQKNPDEVLTQFSDGVLKNEIKFEESIFTKIGNIITPILRKFGFSKIKFNTGKDVYNFLKDYTKSVQKGKISQDIVSAVKDVAPTVDPKTGVAYSTGEGRDSTPKAPVSEFNIQLESDKLKGIAKLNAMIQENEDMGPGNAILRQRRKEEIELQIKKVDELETQNTANELREKLKNAKGINKENIQLALQEKFAAFEGEVETAGLNIETGKLAFSKSINPKNIVQNLNKKGLEVSEKQVNDMVNKISSRAVSKFWSRMSASNQNIVPRKLYKDSAQNLLFEIANNYRKEVSKNTGKQVTFDAYMANTGMQRLNSLAKDLGAKQRDDKSLSDEATLRKAEQQQTTEETSTVKPEITPTIDVMSFANRINPSIDTKAFEKEFTDAVIENAKNKGINLNDPNLTVTQLQSITPYNILAKALDIPANKISNPKDNLGKSESLKVQKALLQARTFVKNVVLSKANKDVQEVASKKKGGKPVKIGGETLKLGRNILNTFFNPPKRVGNNKVRTPKKFDNKVYEQAIGIKDGKVDPNYKPRDDKSQVMKGLVKGIAEQMTNRAIARQPDISAQTVANLDRGKSDLVFSMTKDAELSREDAIPIVENALQEAYDQAEGVPGTPEFINEVLRLAAKGVKGTIYEAKNIAVAIDVSKVIPEFKVVSITPPKSTKDADFKSEVNGIAWNVEVKLKGAQYSSWTINEVDFNTGKINIKKKTGLPKKVIKKIESLNFKGFQKLAAKYGVTINSLNDPIPRDVYEKISKAGGLKLISFNDKTGSLGLKFGNIGQVYDAKGDPVHDIQLQGLGLFNMGKNNRFNLPDISKQPLNAYIRPIPVGIKTGPNAGQYRLTYRVIPQEIKGKTFDIKKSNYSLDNFDTLKNMFVFSESSPPIQNAITKANEVLEDGLVFSESSKGKKAINKIKDSQPKNLDKGFNDIIQETKGIKSEARYSDIGARRAGRTKGRFRFFIPPGAEDFKGLLYNFLGKGKAGERHFQFFDKNLLKPYWQAIAQIERFRRALKNDYATLLKNSPDVRKKLGQKIPTKGKTQFTYDHAIRAYLMTQSGYDLTEAGLSKRDAKLLVDTVKNNPELVAFVQGLQLISKQDKWLKPTGGFDVQTIQSDIHRFTSGEGRKKFLENSGFMQNVNEIFSKQNLNKIEAAYGKNVREALEDTIYRMKNGTNRPAGTNRLTNTFNNWVNRSVGAIMFFNRKSALLQTISSVNFINWSDNNPLKAAIAFANQKQYWSDFAFIFNSPKLKERRAGLKGDINEAEIADAARGATNKAEAVLSYLLKIGFTPTQLADSFAIASGGATFYRNRINTYLKQGMNQQAAEKKAWQDFSRISEESQQSADPAMISEQQASPLGRFTLNFQNTPMQYTRLMKRAGQDLINRRRIPGLTQAQSDATYISKIIYYGAVQNFIFAALQNALFAVIPGFGGEDDEEELTKEQRKRKKELRIANNMTDTILRGTGVYGAIAATLKNTVIKFYENEQKDPFAKDNADIILEAANLSPVIGSKLRKLNNALKTREFEKDVIEERGWEITRDGRLNLSPSYRVLGSTAEALLNVPLERAIAEIDALVEMTDQRNSSLERIALALGWRTWDIGVPNEEEDQIKVEVKERKKQERKDKLQREREEKKRLEEEKRFEGLTPKEINNLKRRDQIQALTKKQQVDSLISLGVSKAMIRSLRLESDRIDKIIEINTK